LNRTAFVAATAACALAEVQGARAQTPPLTEVSYSILNPSAQEWPLLIGQAQGFFHDEGLNVTVLSGNSAPNVVNELATGAVDIGDNGTDTWISAVQHGLPIKMVAPVFGENPYALVVQPSIKTWADLRGKAVMVGTKQDVTAIALGQMAAAQKLKLDDFAIVAGGNSSARFAALMSGNVQGATLSQPYDLEAVSQGMHVLAEAADTAKGWLMTAIAVQPAWAAKNRATVVKVLRATRRAIRFGYAQRDATVAILVSATHVDPAIAGRAYDINFKRRHAFDPDLKMIPNAFEIVGKAMVEFGVIPAIPSRSDLYDPSFLAEAVR
jgi:NitT/TauT family transport system substrate-binding protein